jgi:NADH dehydrogenase
MDARAPTKTLSLALARLRFPTVLANVLVLGASGFLGRRALDLILDEGHNVRVIVRDPLQAPAIQARGVDVVVGSVLDPQTLLLACGGADHVVSMVAARRNRPHSFLEVNVDHPRLVGESARQAGVRSIVYVSAIGSGIDTNYRYLTSRYMGEDQLSQSGVSVSVLRFGMIVGEDGGILRTFDRAQRRKLVMVIPGSGRARFQPILRDDAARCVAEAITRPDLLDQALDLGGPEILSYEQLFGLFCRARRILRPRLHMPMGLMTPVASVMEFLRQDPMYTTDELRSLRRDYLASSPDVVKTHFDFEAAGVSDWILKHWQRRG